MSEWKIQPEFITLPANVFEIFEEAYDDEITRQAFLRFQVRNPPPWLRDWLRDHPSSELAALRAAHPKKFKEMKDNDR